MKGPDGVVVHVLLCPSFESLSVKVLSSPASSDRRVHSLCHPLPCLRGLVPSPPSFNVSFRRPLLCSFCNPSGVVYLLTSHLPSPGLRGPLCVTHGSVGCFWLPCPVYNQPFVIGTCVEWIPSKEGRRDKSRHPTSHPCRTFPNPWSHI